MYEVQLHNTGQIFQWYLRFCRSLIYQALHEQQKLFIQPDQESRQNKCPISMQTGMEGWEKCSGQERSTWSSFDSLPSPRQVVSISAAVTPKSTSPRWQKLQATRQPLNINMVQRICSAAVMSRAEQKKKKKSDADLRIWDLCQIKMFVNLFASDLKSLKFCVHMSVCMQYTILKRYLNSFHFQL